MTVWLLLAAVAVAYWLRRLLGGWEQPVCRHCGGVLSGRGQQCQALTYPTLVTDHRPEPQR